MPSFHGAYGNDAYCPTRPLWYNHGMSRTLSKDADILSRLEVSLTPDGARDILKIEFSLQDKERMRELMEKANRGTRTPEEDDEASEFERLGHVFSMLKSIARRTLNHA